MSISVLPRSGLLEQIDGHECSTARPFLILNGFRFSNDNLANIIIEVEHQTS